MQTSICRFDGVYQNHGSATCFSACSAREGFQLEGPQCTKLQAFKESFSSHHITFPILSKYPLRPTFHNSHYHLQNHFSCLVKMLSKIVKSCPALTCLGVIALIGTAVATPIAVSDTNNSTLADFVPMNNFTLDTIFPPDNATLTLNAALAADPDLVIVFCDKGPNMRTDSRGESKYHQTPTSSPFSYRYIHLTISLQAVAVETVIYARCSQATRMKALITSLLQAPNVSKQTARST